MKHLGIDYGTKRVGLAISDESGAIGFPYAILANTKALIEELCAVIDKEGVEKVVLGESKNLDGKDNPIASKVRELGQELNSRTNLPVEYESEVFTSEAARALPHKEEKTRAPKKHEPIDDSAAALILTAYLSRANHE